MIYFFTVSLIVVGLSSAPSSKSKQAHTQKAQVQSLEVSEKKAALDVIQGYLASIGKKDEALVRKHLSPILQRLWGDETIKGIANDKTLSDKEREIEILDSLKNKDGNVFVRFKTATSKKSAEIPWYILKMDPQSKQWLIEDVTAEANPRSEMK